MEAAARLYATAYLTENLAFTAEYQNRFERNFYIARPMVISDAKCLDCHTTPEVAPPPPSEALPEDIPLTVLEAVNRAGGFGPEADHSRVLLTRKGTTYRVDIQAMYETGATEQNALLEPGEIAARMGLAVSVRHEVTCTRSGCHSSS